MADIADLAQDHMEREEAARLAARKPSLPFNGQCHNCEAPVAADQHFCDAACREDFEKRQRAERQRPEA